MRKTIIDLVVNLIKVNIDAYRSLVGGEPYEKEETKDRNIRFKSTYMYVCLQSTKSN